MHFESPDDKARMFAILDEYKFEYEISSSGKANIEITPVNVNKGNALQRLCSYLNIPIEQTMTIGDEKNDISMLSLSPHSVTLKSSSDIVRQSAKYVIDEQPSIVVGKAISLYVLGK
jgi:hydroxymethylpyrimidine pyrophosphatase-like HAD family hydrolase